MFLENSKFIYDSIDKMRQEKKSFDAIESYLTHKGCKAEDIQHAIHYSKNREKNELWELEIYFEDDGHFRKIISIIIFSIVAIASLYGFYYFATHFYKVLTTPDQIVRGNTLIIFDDFSKSKLSIFLFVLSFLTLFASGLFINLSLDALKSAKGKRLRYNHLKSIQSRQSGSKTEPQQRKG